MGKFSSAKMAMLSPLKPKMGVKGESTDPKAKKKPSFSTFSKAFGKK